MPSVETIRVSLTGNDRDEHVFSLRQSLALYDTYQSQIAECDRGLNASMAALIDEVEKPAKPLSKARVQTKRVNALAFDVRAALYGMLGVDLTLIQGLGLRLLEARHRMRRDLKAWPTAKHFTSWLALLPKTRSLEDRCLRPRRDGLRAELRRRPQPTSRGSRHEVRLHWEAPFHLAGGRALRSARRIEIWPPCPAKTEPLCALARG
jgi:hypothetical protein